MQSAYGGYARVEKTRDGWLPCLKLKGKGRLDLGEYPTDRLAAVAHDIARLMLIREMRPASDLQADKGTHFHPDAYLSDRIFKNLCAENTSFEDVCDLLRSGVLAEQFVCAHDRHTRHTRSLSSGSAGSRQRSGTAAAAAAAAQAQTKQQQQEEQEEKQRQQEQQEQQEQHNQQQAQQEEQQQQQQRAQVAATRGLATAEPDAARLQKKADSVSPGSRLPMCWVEWPTKGDGQFLSCISEDALEAGMTLPSRMKRELFQTTGASAQIAAHDLSTGSTLRWTWEVRDSAKETCVHNLGPFLTHFKARAGDVLVVVAAAPGAVKATVWRGDSADAARFKASLQKGRSRHAGGPASGGRVSKKRPADTIQQPRQQAGPSKAAKAATPPSSLQAATAPMHADCSTGAKQAQQEGTQQQQQRTLQLPSPPVLPQPQAHVLSSELLAAAGPELYGCQPSTCDNDGQQQSPTGQVAQSPYRQQLLPPLACAAVKVKQEQQIAALPGVEGVPVAAGVDETAAGGSGAGIAAAAAPGPPLSPARVSYADASPALMQQHHHQQQQQQQQQQQAPAGPLPDPLAIVGDDNAVFYEMSRLLVLIAGTGCVPSEAVSTYRRSFACLEPAGRRFFHFESLKTFYDAADWGQIQQWLQAA